MIAGLKEKTVKWLLRGDFLDKAQKADQGSLQAASGWAMQEKLAMNARLPSKHSAGRGRRTTPQGTKRVTPVGRRRVMKRELARLERGLE